MPEDSIVQFRNKRKFYTKVNRYSVFHEPENKTSPIQRGRRILDLMISSIFPVFFSSLQTFNISYTLHSEKAMAPHSRTLVWKIPWTEEPGRLQSMGLLRIGHDWATSLSLFTFMHWRRKWQPTPVFLPGESQGWGSLVCCHLWGRIESDTIEVT